MIHKDFDRDNFITAIFNPNTNDYNGLSLDLFHYQYKNNEDFKQYCDLLKISSISKVEQIPFFPIRFFKTKEVKTGNWSSTEAKVFTSSGTTGILTSKHFVRDISIYEKSFNRSFEIFYGNSRDFVFLGLLPSYLERENSSLIYMVNKLMELSGSSDNGFYLDDYEKLAKKLKLLEAENKKVILFGVSFALLDFANEFKIPLANTIIIETGGMKGRRKEMTREELHTIYKNSFGNIKTHSEYGMTELLSQAYSKGDGKFNCPPWMKIIITAIDDPFKILPSNKSGRINIIDLANIDSCAFIASDDLGKLGEDGSFEILGRIDNSDQRGCNLLI